MNNQLKRKFYTGAIALLSSALIFVGCTSHDDKPKDENQETVVTTTTTNSSSEWTVYKEATEKTIATNDERIKMLKEKISKSNTPNLDKLREKRIDALQEQNEKLRAKIADYKEEEAKSNWEQFKADVKKELDDIEASLKDLDKDNK